MHIHVAVNGLVIFRMWLGFAELGITGLFHIVLLTLVFSFFCFNYMHLLRVVS